MWYRLKLLKCQTMEIKFLPNNCTGSDLDHAFVETAAIPGKGYVCQRWWPRSRRKARRKSGGGGGRDETLTGHSTRESRFRFGLGRKRRFVFGSSL